MSQATKIFIIVLVFVTVMYASLIREHVPGSLSTLFRNSVFQLIYLTLLAVFILKQNLVVAGTMSAILIASVYTLNLLETSEHFTNANSVGPAELESVPANKFEVNPSCLTDFACSECN